MKYVTEKLETQYPNHKSTGLRMETQKSANSFVKIYFLNSKNLENMILAGAFNSNALDLEQNKKVQSLFTLMYRYNMVRTINKL